MTVQNQDSAINQLIGVENLQYNFQAIMDWVSVHLLTWNVAIQLALLIGAFIPAILFGPRLRDLIKNRLAPLMPAGILHRIADAVARAATPIALLVTQKLLAFILVFFNQSAHVIESANALLTAWIIIRLVSLAIRSKFWSSVAFYTVWPIAALDALGLLDGVLAQLDAISFTLGSDEEGAQQSLTALDVVRTFAIIGLFLWVSSLVNHFIRGRLTTVEDLTPSFRALIIKILDIALPVVSLMIGLQVVGFNVATLTIFGGAIALGIGLGLQRTISNFFAGFTLIVDKSIKPGDVVQVDGSYGWVTHMGSRCVTVQTRDGFSKLIPNDKFIENGVTNWSHNNKKVRITVKFGISYSFKDLKLVKAQMEGLTSAIDRVLKTPKPQCHVVEFGESSVDFVLRFWINDPANGVTNIKGEVMLAIWDKLEEMGIEIPYAQRDLHIKSVSSLDDLKPVLHS